MRKLILGTILLLSTGLLVRPLSAADLKFTTPADLDRSLAAIVAPTALSVVKEEGGFLRFHSDDKMRFCQMALSSNGVALKQENGEVMVKFRFGAEKQSFGVYLRVYGEDDPAYLVLVSTWVKGQGIIRLFKVPPRAQADDQHQIAKQVVSFPLNPASWYTLKIKTAAQGERATQLTAEVAPATEGTPGATTVVTAVDPESLREAGQLNIRFFTSDSDQNIDVKEITTSPAPAPAH